MGKEKIFVAGVEVEFNDLLESSQKRLYLQDKDKFEEYAAKSQFSRIRKLIIEDKNAKTANLEVIFRIELATKSENMQELWYHPNFQRTDEKRRMLSKSENIHMRLLSAKDEEGSSEILNEQLLVEIQGKELFSVIEAILNNKNLKIKEEYRKMLVNSKSRNIRELVAKEETSSSEFLNEMLRKELEGEKCGWIVTTIINNKNFVMEQETRQMLVKSEKYTLMELAVQDKGCSSQFLNQICRQFLLDRRLSSLVTKNIITHENFKLEEETLDMICKSASTDIRKKLARDPKTSYETLEKMYAKEKEEEVLVIIELQLLRRLVK